MSATPTGIVRGFYDALAAGDADRALALMAPDIEWITMWHYQVAGRGPAAVAAGLLAPLAAEWSRFSLVPERFVADGDTVVSLGVFRGVHGATGRSCEARTAHVWTIAGGRIARFRQYIDTLAVETARHP